MNIREILFVAESHGVKLRVDGADLAVRAPKGVLTPELREALAAHKAELITFLRANNPENRTSIPRTHAVKTELGRLSAGQARLWFFDRLVPAGALYNVHFGLRMKGALDADALQASLTAIVARQEMLRATFPEVEGQPRVVVAPARAWEMPAIDLRRLDPDDKEAERRRISAEDATAPFDLARGPLMRTALLALDDEDHVLLVSQHHIITDAWSIGLFARDLANLYRDFRAGERRELAELPIRYADYVRWQETKLTGEDAKRSEAWWKQNLAGLPLLDLPTSRGLAGAPTHAGDAYSFALSPELTSGLKDLARRESCTLFVALLTVWAALLHRYSQQVDFGIGTVTAGRDRSELRDLIGFFVNTLVLRCDLSGDPEGAALMRRLRGVVEGALHHGEVPFDRIVSVAGASRGQDLNPLFRASFVLENAPVPRVTVPGMVWTPMLQKVDGGAPGTTKFEIGLTMMETGGELLATLEYSTDLFHAGTIERMAGHFQMLAKGLVAEPGRRLSELSLLTAGERQKLVVEWNETKAAYPHDRCIHELFEAQVEETPEAVAVVFEEQQLTYRELNQRANQLAHHLRPLGVGPDVLVGICMARSLEMVVGLLGILKAGGAYVPLDPTYPKERLGFMLEDCGAPVLLTQERLIATLPEHRARVLTLDAGWKGIAQERTDDPAGSARPDNLAYVIYTSGSTGRPKGVCTAHRGVVRLVKNTGYARFAPDEVFLQLAPLAFDASTLEIWGPLLSGGRLEVFPAERPSLSQIGDVIAQRGVTTLWLTGGLFNAMIDAHPEALRPLRRLLAGGEALSVPHVRKALAELPGLELINGYGPTEGTTFTCCHPITSTEGASVPIGRPIANTIVYLLDAQLKPVPIGVPGELYIGGAGVARGYLNRPELTAEKFLPDPFYDEPGARLYKTGDLCRWRPDGDLEYLGRLDHQVKIHGFRIELGEIESVLGQHPAVRAAAVLAREDAPGGKRLVAYLAAREAPLPKVSELRSYLQSKLPEYMVPAAFVELPALPLSPNGKVDRRALPAPDYLQAGLSGGRTLPRNSTEQRMAAVWAEVLGVNEVGIHDNFFEVGGHSLLATKLISRLSPDFPGLRLPMLFAFPTVAALAEQMGALAQQELPPAPRPASPDLPSSIHSPAEQAAGHTIERRSLLTLFATGMLGPVDAAALATVPATMLASMGVTRDELLQREMEGLPRWHAVLTLSGRRIALIVLPVLDSEIYNEPHALVGHALNAMELAGKIGARFVSLTGLIPSATDYGRSIAAAVTERRDLPRLTTGHATTSAAVVLNILRLLDTAGRSLPGEHLAVLGLGSIGRSVLRLAMRCLPAPRALTLCDVYGKLDLLHEMAREAREQWNLATDVRVTASRSGAPPELYDATLIVGATNVPDVVDVDRLRPGTLLVDDSAPHCFARAPAVKRLEDRGDLLFTEGGGLELPQPIEQLVYLPEAMRSLKPQVARSNRHSRVVMGCVFSSLLSATHAAVSATVGDFDPEVAKRHYETLQQLGICGTHLHCEEYDLPAAAIQRFRERFGR